MDPICSIRLEGLWTYSSMTALPTQFLSVSGTVIDAIHATPRPSDTPSLDITTVGVSGNTGGRDQSAAFTAGDVIFLHLIGDANSLQNSTSFAIMASLSDIMTPLPSGFLSQALIAPVRLLPTSVAMPKISMKGLRFLGDSQGIHTGGPNCTVSFVDAINQTNVLSGGTAVNSTPNTGVLFDDFVPPQAHSIQIECGGTNSGSTCVHRIGPAAGWTMAAPTSLASTLVNFSMHLPNIGGVFYYANGTSGGSLSAFVLDYEV
jgi:hypothetical protein